MVHGIYLRNRPKSKWHLVSIAMSTEKAKQGVDLAINQAKSEGYDDPQAVIQTFDSAFYIPEYLSNVKEQKILLN